MILGMSLPSEGTIVMGLNIFFIIVVALTFIWGFFRGVRKSIFYTLFFVGGAVALWFSLTPLAEKIYTMDLSFVGPIETNLKDYIHQIVDEQLEFSLTDGTYSYEAINGVVLCVLKIALFFILVVFWIVLYRFIVWFIWGILGKPFLKIKKVKKPSPENRALAKTINDKKKKKELLKPIIIKKKKHRLLGGLVGAINGFVMSLFLCVPIGGLCSIVNTANETAKSLEGEPVDSEIQEILEFGDAYDQSWMAKLLDKFGKEDGVDTEMFDKLFTIEASEDEKIKIRGEINTLAKFALQTSQSGIIELSEIDAKNITPEDIQSIQPEYIVEAFKTLGDLHLLDVIFNVGVDFMEYSDFIHQDESLKNLYLNYDDLREVKLSQDIVNFGKIIEVSLEILAAQKDLNEIDYKNFEQEKLEELVVTLFDIKLLNIGIDTGLSYALSLDEVIDFVGDNQVNYENIDWKKDLLSIVGIYDEVIEVLDVFVGKESVSITEVAKNCDHIQNILETLFDLDVFNEVKEIAIDFAMAELESNEEIAQYIPEEVFTELKENGSETLFHELSTILNLFKDLDEKTTLLSSLDEYLSSEDPDAKFVLDMDPMLVNILADYIDESDIAQPIVLNFAKLSNDSLQEEMGIDLYGALSNVDKLSDELRIVGHILEGIEAEGGDINQILTDMSSEGEVTTIDLALINGLVNEEKAAYKDEQENIVYYIDESELLKRIIGPILDNAMSDLLNGETLFADDDFVWSKEVKLLSELATIISETSGGEEGKLDISALQSSFETQIHIDVIKALRDNSQDSMLIDKVIKVALSSMVEEEGSFDNITDWSVEIDALYQVANTMTNEDGFLVVAELESLNKIKVETIDAAARVAGNSELIKIFFKEPLTDMSIDTTLITNWGEELDGLASIIKTIAIEENGEKVIYLDNLESQFSESIPLSTLAAVKDIFAEADENTSTVIVRTLFETALTPSLVEEGFFEGWTNATWGKELNALYSVASTMANDEGKLNIEELSNLTTIKVATLEVAATVADDSTLAQSLLKQPLTDMGVNIDEITSWSEELDGLVSVARTIAVEQDDELVLDINNIGTQLENEVPLATLKAVKDTFVNANEETSTVILRTLFEDALCPSVVEEGFFNGYTNAQWANELNSLYVVAATMANEDDKLVISELSNLTTIKVATLDAAATVIDNSSLAQHLFKQPLTDMGVDTNEITNWGEEINGLSRVARTIAIEQDGELVLDINNLGSQLENEIPLATLATVKDVFDEANENTSTVILRTLFEDALCPSVVEEGFFEGWTNAIWGAELNALYSVASTMANDEGNLVIEELSNLTTIKVATLDAAATVIDNSSLAQHLFKQPLTDMGVDVEKIECWSEELEGLANIARTIAVEQDGELVLDINNVETQLSDEIPLAALEAARDVFKDANEGTSTVIVRTLFEDALKSTITEPGFFDGWTNAKWYTELSSLTDIASTLATESNGEQVLSVSALSNMKTLYIATLDAMLANNISTNEPNVDSSDIIQHMAKDGFAAIIGEEQAELIGTPGHPLWSDEVEVIKAMTEGNTYTNQKGEYIRLVEEPGVDEVSIDKKLTSESSDKVKWSIINTASMYVENSLLLQTILEEPFKTMLGEEELNWTGTRWEIEVGAVAAVTEDLQDDEGYISTSLTTNKLPVSVLEKASENTRSLIVKKMMSDTLTPMYSAQDASQTPANWNSDERWEKEIVALCEIIKPLQDDEGYINISESFMHRNVKLAMFDEMEEHIANSTVLQSKIAQEVYVDGTTRINGTPEVSFGNEEWHNEMIAIDTILHTIPEEDRPDASVSYDNIDFTNIKFASLEATRDNIHRSVFLQHKMYVSLEGIKLENDTFTQYEFSTEAQWYNEIDVLINVTRAFVGVNEEKININELTFDGSIKFTVLDVIAESLDKSTFIQSKFRNSMYSNGTGHILGTPAVRYGETKWLNEALAIDELAKVLANGQDAISLNMFDFSNDSFGIPVAVLDTLMVYTDYSVYVQDKLVQALDGIIIANGAQEGVQVGTQLVYPLGSTQAKSTHWYKELEALKAVAVELAGANGTLKTSTIDFNNGIKMSVIATMRDNIHYSTFLQTKLEEALFAGASVKPKVEFSLTQNQWNNELDAMYQVGVAWFGINGSINPVTIGNSLDSGFPVAVLEELSNVIYKSLYFQTQLQPKLIAMAPNGYYTVADIPVAIPSVANNNNAHWTSDLTALYKAMNSIATSGNIQFNLNFENEINYSLLTTLVDDTNGTPIIAQSKLLQALLKDTIDTLGTIDQNRSDIVGTEFKGFAMQLGYEGTIVSGKSYTVAEQWIVELSSIIAIASTQVDGSGMIRLSSLSAENFDRDFLAMVVDVMDETNTTTYGMPVVLRALMIPVLESISRTGITFEAGFNWASTDTVISDLQYLLNAFDELGLTSIDQFNKNNINLMKAYSLITNYGSKSILIKAIAENIVAQLMG